MPAVDTAVWPVATDVPTAQHYYYMLKMERSLATNDKVQFFLDLCVLISLRTGHTVDEITMVPMTQFDTLVSRVYAPIRIWARTRGMDLSKMTPQGGVS
jgi:hypothetical protein